MKFKMRQMHMQMNDVDDKFQLSFQSILFLLVQTI